MMENMKINQLPSKTWNWLKMNETAVSGISVSGAHKGNLEIPEGIKKLSALPVFRTVLRMSQAAWDPIWTFL